jgi:hypothetical protein
VTTERECMRENYWGPKGHCDVAPRYVRWGQRLVTQGPLGGSMHTTTLYFSPWRHGPLDTAVNEIMD